MKTKTLLIGLFGFMVCFSAQVSSEPVTNDSIDRVVSELKAIQYLMQENKIQVPDIDNNKYCIYKNDVFGKGTIVNMDGVRQTCTVSPYSNAPELSWYKVQ